MLLKLDRSDLIDAHLDAQGAAEAADLKYVCDDRPGISRRRFGRGFAYYDSRGRRIRDADEIGRIKKLAIPPAYRDVWICPDPLGHLQATGRDDRGRKQYRYHKRWSQLRDRAKFARLVAFAGALPRLRRTLRRHLRLRGLPREKVLAACVTLLDKALMRVGNDDYAKHNNSYGATTLQDDHASFEPGGVLRFEYNGKHGIEREVSVKDSQLARIIKQCQDLPGQELLQYVDQHGAVMDIGSGDVNDYLRQYAGPNITAKDFRTWHATVLAATALRDEAPAAGKSARNKQILAAVDQVAGQLGNTRAICRKCYVHPLTLETFDAGDLKARMKIASAIRGLSADEAATLKLLKSTKK